VLTPIERFDTRFVVFNFLRHLFYLNSILANMKKKMLSWVRRQTAQSGLTPSDSLQENNFRSEVKCPSPTKIHQ
jgi:hypothetical protein